MRFLGGEVFRVEASGSIGGPLGTAKTPDLRGARLFKQKVQHSLQLRNLGPKALDHFILIHREISILADVRSKPDYIRARARFLGGQNLTGEE